VSMVAGWWEDENPKAHRPRRREQGRQKERPQEGQPGRAGRPCWWTATEQGPRAVPSGKTKRR
jgi:hypothetical protein